MIVKWVCSVCETVNRCEQSEKMKCIVCGKERTDESLMTQAEIIPLPSTGKSVSAHANPQAFGDRIRNWLVRLKMRISSIFHTGHITDEITGWSITRSAADSKEAYLTASPVYSDTDTSERALPPPTLIPEHIGHIHPFLPDGDTLPSVITDDPWPEHRIGFNTEKLSEKGFYRVERMISGGKRGYMLTGTVGSSRFITAETMITLGFAGRM